MSDNPRDELLDLVRQLAVQVAWQRDMDLVELPLRSSGFVARPAAEKPAPVAAAVVAAASQEVPAEVPEEAPEEAPEEVPADVPEVPPSALVVEVVAPAAVVMETPAPVPVSRVVEAPAPAVVPTVVEAPAPLPVVSVPAPVVAAPAPTRSVDRSASPVFRGLFGEEPKAPEVVIPARVDGARRVEALRVVQDEVAGCTVCRLAAGRTQTVFARGNPFARIVFVGEAPGEHEDLQGLPFVGASGRLLDRIITMGMGLSPATDVYIANITKCRPPSNRNPEPDEMAACGPFLQRQLGIIRPEVIVILGKVAAHYLLKVSGPMGKLRGQWTAWEGIPVMPTWHPSYLLHEEKRPGSTARREVWTDVQRVMERLNLPRPAR